MNILVNILSLVVVLGVVVFLHEGGHFLLARLAGARVSVFSLGFGKRLWGFTRGQTDYRVSAIPLGGYVRIHGLGPDHQGNGDKGHRAHGVCHRAGEQDEGTLETRQ